MVRTKQKGSDEITWEEPPGSNSGGSGAKGVWAERLTPLMKRPGKWARVGGYKQTPTYQEVTNLRKRVLLSPPGRWEFTARKVTGKGYALYARYLGPEEEA